MPPDSPSARAVAVIDVGSNSIKVLVAAPGDPVTSLFSDIEETRISAGISRQDHSLQESSMQAGLASIQALLARTRSFPLAATAIVATSAVRGAANGAEFAARVEAATGLPLRVLSGDEEARLIALGASCDPALRGTPDFRMTDLGGGSLEIIHYAANEMVFARSYPLGAVRLTERFLGPADGPIDPAVFADIDEHIQAVIRADKLNLSDPRLPLVGTGGGYNIARAILNPSRSPFGTLLLSVDRLIQLRDKLAVLPLEDRKMLPGLPPQRADIMPIALQTMISIARLARIPVVIHSRYNLRWGLAREMLEKIPS